MGRSRQTLLKPTQTPFRPASAPPPPAGAYGNGPKPQGFTGPGMRQIFDAILPMRGGERREFFNRASTGLVVGLGLGGVVIGYSWAGPIGALLGLGVGATLGGIFVEKWRFFRR